MPKVSEFFGIAIYFYFNDHQPPHFHARYQGQDGEFAIDTLALLAGELPPKARALVVEWASQHQTELRSAWESCRNGEKPVAIAPLQ
ncbi:MAG: DUF4160 domain-containing protein [Planctomycetes bacterium]|nr:DUF4160 domain-containing protein [Planctomycetota bacterium]